MHKLEKLNSSIDIIPLQISNMDNSNNAARRLAIGKPTADKPRQVEDPSGRVPMRDPMIISRVRTYLYENEDKVYIDVTEMADCLQRKYRDYRGKKRGPFRAMVRKAYDEITENLTRQADSHWQEDDDDIDIEVDAMPSDYLQAYKRQLGRQNGNSSDKELIDISSDDDQAPNNAAKSNKDAMEIEHISKKPHLSPSVESVKAVQQPQEIPLDGQSKNRPERTRKRLREKENDNTQETNIKKKYRDIPVINPTISFHDFGGNAKVLETVANLLLHIKHPEVYIKLNISPPRGFLLHGPPGCGKTLLAHAIAGELKIPLLKVAAPELVAGVSGESEQRIRELFEQAIAVAPCILFLDEIDAIAPHRATAQKEMERRMVSQLLSCLDELGMKDNGTKVLVVGATNRPDAIDPALRRAGRFDREVSLGIPDREARSAILETLTAVMPLYRDVNLEKVAALTPGFVGADLVALIREAAMAAVNRVFDMKKTVPVPALPAAVTPDSSVPATENKIAEEEEKPVPVPEQDISDIIIEDDIPAKVDTTDPKADQKEVEVVSTEEEKASTSEQEKQPEKLVESSEVVESTVEQPEVSSVPGPSSEVTEVVEAEPAPVVETTDVLIAPSENTSAEPAEVQESTAEKAEESVLPMQVDKIDKVKSEPKVEEVGRTLEDIRALLHDEPPLTAEQLDMLCITQQDFDIALKNVQPSAKREGFATVPDVTWDDIGSLQDIREELQMTILAPIRHADHFASLGLNTPTGVLLCGPPGCGKTLLAKAIANEAGINFISVKGPELLNMYVGESEKAVRQCFLRARNSAPCVIFFDELDALCPKRSEGDSTATSRVVNQMLTEMDGVEGRKNVFLMAASNRPDIIDPAVLRPGRLDKILYVGLPNPHDRVDILKALTKNGTKPKLAADVDIETVATSERLDGYTGADIAAFVREAGVEALREIMSGLSCPAEICARHLDAAFEKIRPSVQDKDIKHYEKLQKLYSVKKKSLNTDVPMSLEPVMDSTMEAMET